MKVLAIMGSPRKGDSYRITRRVETRMKELGPVDFEYVFLKDIDIQLCQGCFLCTSKGEEHCPIRDDCPTVLDKMLAADGVLFVSPVYALSVTGLMKNFKDRLAYNAHRPRFFGKYGMSIVTSAGTGLEGAINYLNTFSLWGFKIVRGLALVQYPHLQPTAYLEEQTSEKIRLAAARFHRALTEKKQTPPSLSQVLQFRVLKCNTIAAGDFWQADGEFFKDRPSFFYPAHIAPLKRLAAWLFEKFYWRFMRKNYVLPKDV